jgi:hypothetical protein
MLADLLIQQVSPQLPRREMDVKRSRLRSLEETWPIARVTLLDLYGRPFLHEQGNTVTRGVVWFLEVDATHWQLVVTDVEFLDKTTGAWRPDDPEATYGGSIERSRAIRHWSGLNPIFDVGIELAGYGVFVFIGRRSANPWSENDWPELDTDMLSPGPMVN